jgi:ribosomal protein S6--L-glutamate ligase
MNIGILSRDASLYSTRRLVEAAQKRGHDVRVIDYLRCYMDIDPEHPKVLYAGERLGFDAVIPRIGARYTFYGTAVVRQFEVMQTLSANSSISITRSRDKLRSMQLLAQKGVGLPTTGFAHSTKDVDGLIGIVGGAPLVIKLLEGTQGTGVVLAQTDKAAESVISAFRQLDANILVQRFVKEADGEGIRAFVVGGKVVGAMSRKAAPGDFRSNLHRGGTARKVKITPAERAAAVQAAKVMGLGVAGVDLLRSSKGPAVIEVNSSPGLEGIEKATGLDVADRIVAYLESRLNERSDQKRSPDLAG